MKEILKIRKLSAKKFAGKIGVSEAMVYKYYKMDDVDTSVLKKWAFALRLPMLFFLDEIAYNTILGKEKGTSIHISIEDEEEKRRSLLEMEWAEYIFYNRLVVSPSFLDEKESEIKELNREIGRLQVKIEILEKENCELRSKLNK